MEEDKAENALTGHPKPQTRRTKKAEQFVRARIYGYNPGVTTDMIHAARLLLQSAAVESANCEGASRFVPGAVLLAVTAFELYLNYLIVSITLPDSDIQNALDRPNAVSKIDFLTNTFETRCPKRKELEMVIEVRNEIAHHFPRPGWAPENIPWWYEEIQKRGLLITSSRNDGSDFDLGQKLGSFNLAYWANRVIIDAVADLLRGSSHPVATMNTFERSNFPLLLHGVAALR
jgi:hypothetical protein